MTREKLYDLMLKRYTDPALFTLGPGRCILGYWVKRSESKEQPLLLESKTHGIVKVDEAESWEALARKLGEG